MLKEMTIFYECFLSKCIKSFNAEPPIVRTFVINIDLAAIASGSAFFVIIQTNFIRLNNLAISYYKYRAILFKQAEPDGKLHVHQVLHCLQ